MLENVNLQKEQGGTTAARLRLTARRAMVWWQMGIFFLISIKKGHRQGQRFRQILAHSSQRPRHNVGGMLGATVGLGQGSVCLGFAGLSWNPSCQDWL